ncbi:MAG TPA: NfeD family protein [Alcaligenes sp.]|nr:NfeD family protein [Alcaligenes faecalis]HRL20312.1 NfeD family protein [Alcaligenes sp.]
MDYQWLAYLSFALALAALLAEVSLGGTGALSIVAALAGFNGIALLWVDNTELLTYSSTAFMVLVAALLLLLALTVWLAWRLLRRRSVTGRAALLGSVGEVLAVDRLGQGYALIQGERWHFESNDALQPGQRVEVIAVQGLTLKVQRLRP